ncbi:MAG TPA: FAD-dependent oxidoreductase [Candidatus Saccharimonadales bacterium]|jgi:NADH dehydrogenase|nr:FAD-dependent oxidoreductase [Candidatus Saccharimonadales bacterium]
MTHTKQRILVVGGGFGGVKAALELSEEPQFAVTLISDQPFFSYHPTLFHTATGGSSAQSHIPLATIFAGRPITIVHATADHLDRAKQRIITSDGTSYPYDKLVLALGVVDNYFGIEGLQDFSYGIKTFAQAQRFKAHLHQQLTDEHKPDLNYVIVGGGPTGIELAGALPMYLKRIMKKHGVRGRKVHIDLVEAAPALCPRLPKEMGEAIARRLKRLGVCVYLGKAVQGQTADALMVDGKPIQSHTVVWTAGTANHPFFKANDFAVQEHGGRVMVNKYLQAEPDIYVIGDNADTPYTGMAQTALHDADFVAVHLYRELHGKKLLPYKPKKPIYVTPAGPHWAAVLWGKVQLYGWVGWLLRNAADIRGYHDLESCWLTTKQFMTEFETEESCPVCATKSANA